MDQIEFITAAATNSGAMEADTISKNGRSSKSQMNGILKIKQMFFIMIAFVASVFFYSCGKDDYVPKPSMPSNVEATQSGSYIIITWSTVKGATSYNIYRGNSASQFSFNYPLLGSVNSTTYTDFYPFTGDNYYAVSSVNSAGESSRSIGFNSKNHVNFTSGGGTNGGGGNVCTNIQNNYNNAKKNRDDAQRLYNQYIGTIYASTYANQVSNYNAIMETCKRQARENGCTLIL